MGLASLLERKKVTHRTLNSRKGCPKRNVLQSVEMKPITPFLWYDGTALEAATLYTSTFPNSEVTSQVPGPDGTVLLVNFHLNGQEFMALNGGSQFTKTEGVSFMVHCETQDEIDYFWDKLGEGGIYQACGWLKDRYGLSWQIVPTRLADLMGGDPERSGKVMHALMGMIKLDIAGLEAAYNS